LNLTRIRRCCELPVGFEVMFIAAALLDRLCHSGFLLGLKDARPALTRRIADMPPLAKRAVSHRLDVAEAVGYVDQKLAIRRSRIMATLIAAARSRPRCARSWTLEHWRTTDAGARSFPLNLRPVCLRYRPFGLGPQSAVLRPNGPLGRSGACADRPSLKFRPSHGIADYDAAIDCATMTIAQAMEDQVWLSEGTAYFLIDDAEGNSS